MAVRKKVIVLCYVPQLGWKVSKNLFDSGYDVYYVGCGNFLSLYWFVKRFFPVSGVRTEIVSQVNSVCEEFDVDLILPVDVDASCDAYDNRSMMKADVSFLMDSNQRRSISDKWTFYKGFSEKLKCFPKTQLAGAQIGECVFPVILKPRRGGFGEDITVINDENELRAGFGGYETGAALVQEYIQGVDISCGFIASEGRLLQSIVYEYKGKARSFILDDRVVALSKRIVSVIGYHGVGVIDFRRNIRGDLYLLEVNSRFGGSEVYYPLVGINFSKMACDLMLGKEWSFEIKAEEKDVKESFLYNFLTKVSGYKL